MVSTATTYAVATLADMQPRVLPNSDKSLSEFPDRPGNGLPPIRVGCFTASLVQNLHSLLNDPLTAQYFVQVFDDMVAKRDMDAHGTTMSAGASYVRNILKLQIIEPTAWDWHPGTEASAIEQGMIDQAGINGLILQLDAAGHLAFSEPGVGGHFVAVLGVKVYQGVRYFLIANGDDILALGQHNGHASLYDSRWLTWGQIAPAVPSALLAIVHPSNPVVRIPAGWSDDGSVLTAPNEVKVVKGFRVYILARGNWDAADLPRMAEAGDANASYQVFTKSVLQWTPASNVFARAAGPLDDAFITAMLNVQSAGQIESADTQKVQTLTGVLGQVKSLVASY